MTYEFGIGGKSARIGAQYNYSAKKLYSSIIETPRATLRPTHIVNANVDLKFDDHLPLSVWGTNLLDNRYMSSVFDVGPTLGLVNYAPPRQFGVSGTCAF